jgi:hypothetical protein
MFNEKNSVFALKLALSLTVAPLVIGQFIYAYPIAPDARVSLVGRFKQQHGKLLTLTLAEP